MKTYNEIYKDVMLQALHPVAEGFDDVKDIIERGQIDVVQSLKGCVFDNPNIIDICINGKIDNVKALKGSCYYNDNVARICIKGKLENIKALSGQDYANNTIAYICCNGKLENIKELINNGGVNFSNDKVADVCVYGKLENIKILKGQDFTNKDIVRMARHGEPLVIKKYLNQFEACTLGPSDMISKNIQKYIINTNYKLIANIPEPSVEMCIYAINKNPDAINYINEKALAKVASWIRDETSR